MKKLISYFRIFLLVCIISSFVTSCQKAPINGELDGQWEVIEVFPEPQENVIKERLFYNFSLYVCDLTYYGALFTHGNMRYDGETLWLEFPFVKPWNETGNAMLAQYGISSNPVTFNVNFIDKHNLILSNEESTVVLVKH